MKIGTKSVLYGAHCFFIHPWFVAWAWWKLYGFPWDPRLWVAFFVHDLGYVGKPNMDGEEGEQHPEFGARVMSKLFDWGEFDQWYHFTKYHSRFLAKKNLTSTSKLCVADKYAFCLTPRWLYLFLTKLTGEINEYLEKARAAADRDGKYVSMNVYSDDLNEWHHNVTVYLEAWVREHKDGRLDTWTPEQRRTNG